MIIPIGHEELSLRRIPVVSLGLAAVCILAYVLSAAQESRLESMVQRQYVEALAYWQEHPYLKAPEWLAQGSDEPQAFYTGAAENAIASETHEAVQHHPREAPESEEERAAQQDNLDELTGSVLATVQREPARRFGFVTAHPNMLALLTHMFMHADVLHLLGNLLFLYLSALLIEDFWGRPFFLAFYLCSGVAATIGYWACTGSESVPLVGASGAIAGLMGAFLIRCASTNIRFAYVLFFGRLRFGTFTAPALFMLPLWFASELFYAFMCRSSGGGGVAYWAHVCGFLFGVGVALAVKFMKVEERFLAPAIDRALGEASAPDEPSARVRRARASRPPAPTLPQRSEGSRTVSSVLAQRLTPPSARKEPSPLRTQRGPTR